MKTETLWNACASVLAAENKPLAIRRIAEAAEMKEEEVITALIRHTETQRGSFVTFRYPPLPEAAIIAMRLGYDPQP
jgi:hypothetical protein